MFVNVASCEKSNRGAPVVEPLCFRYIEIQMKNSQFTALFFISAAGIAFELYVMRIFSVGSWSNFGSLVISTALLGIGLAGIILTFIHECA